MKNYLVAVVAIVIAAALIFGIKNLHRTSSVSNPVGNDTTATSTGTSTPLTTEAEKTKEQAWSVFDKYLTALKNHDLPTIKSLSYKISDICADPKRQKDCFLIMDSAYTYASPMKKADFVNVEYDNKQIILSTDYNKFTQGTTSISYTRSIIYFVRDSSLNPQVLALSPDDGAIVFIKDLSPQEVNARLMSLTKDADQDGAPDDIENCVDWTDASKCNTKSDPTKRDTDGDGYWDGTELYLKK